MYLNVLQYHHWDAPPDEADHGHTGRSPSPAHFNGQHSAAKDWSVLASGGTLQPTHDAKPKWAIPEPENEYVKPAVILDTYLIAFYSGFDKINL